MSTDAQRARFPRQRTCWKQRRFVGSLLDGVNGVNGDDRPGRNSEWALFEALPARGDSRHQSCAVGFRPPHIQAGSTPEHQHAVALENGRGLRDNKAARPEPTLVSRRGPRVVPTWQDTIPHRMRSVKRQPLRSQTSRFWEFSRVSTIRRQSWRIRTSSWIAVAMSAVVEN